MKSLLILVNLLEKRSNLKASLLPLGFGSPFLTVVFYIIFLLTID